MRSSLSKACGELINPVLHSGNKAVPVFLCPILLRTTANRHRFTSPRRPLATSTAAPPPPPLPEFNPSVSSSPSRYDPTVSKTALPTTCPGCGALQQTVKRGEAGFYSTTRKSVKAFIAQKSDARSSDQSPEDQVLRAAVEQADDGLLKELGLETIIDATGELSHYELQAEGVRDTKVFPDSSKQHIISLPVCDRCHGLLHHQAGTSIDHPSLQSIRDTIFQSSYKSNHIYHVIDAADFPLSLIPNLHRDLALNPQRSHNRRAKTGKFLRGRRAEVSFIITRSDLLAPRKEQVDSLMPYLVQVLRDALGAAGRDIRLGNVRCVSSQRGWWTKEIKEDIWRRGRASWMVGKVNVGKSRLFESVFPKGRTEGIKYDRPQSYKSNNHHTLSFENPVTEVIRSAERDDSTESIELRPVGSLDERDEESLLPPRSQPEAAFPVMPLVSSVPGTTASPIRLSFGKGKGELIDLPGLFRGDLDAAVRKEHKMDLVMRTRVNPKQQVIKPGQSLLLGGLIRITPINPDIVILAYPFVPIAAHVTSTDKARGIQAQQLESGVDVILEADVGNRMASAGSFHLKWDITKQRSGPLTAPAAVGLSEERLPFRVLSTDILIEGCGWVELVAQVRKRQLASNMSSTAQNLDDGGSDKGASASHAGSDAPVVEVEVFSPEGKHIGSRRPLNAWRFNGENNSSARKRERRPKPSMKGSKKRSKLGQVEQ